MSSYDIPWNKRSSVDPRRGFIAPSIPWVNLSQVGIGLYPSGTPANVPGMGVNAAAHHLKAIGYFQNSQGLTTASTVFSSALGAFQTRFMKLQPNKTVLDQTTFNTLAAVRKLHDAQVLDYWTCFKTPSQTVTPRSINYVTRYTSTNQDSRLMGPPFFVVLHDTEVNLTEAMNILLGHTKRDGSNITLCF